MTPPSTSWIEDVGDAAEVPPAPENGAPRTEPPLLGLSRVLVLIAGLGIVALGLTGGLAAVTLALLARGSERLAGATVGISVIALTAGLGLPLAWHAWQAMQGRPSLPFRPRRPWPLVAAFFLAVAAGQLALNLGLVPSLLFPPFHVIAALAPPVVILVLVARGLGPTGRWRDTVLHLSSGAFLATPLAFLLEGVFILGIVALLVGGLALRPGGAEMLQGLAESTWLQDPQDLLPLLVTPGVVAAALLITAVFVPVVEELVKAVGVGLVAYRRPHIRQAMLWGLAGGAGFAMVEALFNTMGSLPSWAPVIVLRVGASLLHCTAGALMGIAWHHLLVVRRWGPALGLFLAAIAIHAAWNTVSVGVAFLSLGTISPDGSVVSLELAAVGSAGLVGFLAALSAGMALLLAVLTRRLARRDRPAGDEPTGSPAGTGA
jgi:RsiW-degrading membrane proteinase PrsW (M82 family)